MDLTEGDKTDNWNSFTTKDGIVRDLNFHISDDNELFFRVYGLTDNGDETWSTNSSDSVSIKIIQVIGSIGKYLDIPFDGTKSLTFELIDSTGKIVLKTKKFNKACDIAYIDKLTNIAIDVYGNRKQLN